MIIKDEKIYYRDLDISIDKHIATNDLIINKNVKAIQNSLINLIQTKKGEKPFQPDVGSNIYSLLFELPTPNIESLLQQLIVEVIEKQEKRIINPVVNISSTQNEYNVLIAYEFKGTPQNISFTLGTQT
jgi:uncharacterized protein